MLDRWVHGSFEYLFLFIITRELYNQKSNAEGWGDS